jgi:rhamnosyltransferase
MRIHCIVVAFHPDVVRLHGFVQVLTAGGLSVVVVDNTPVPIPMDLPAGCKLISLADNTGIAHAQNVGIDYARRQGAEVLVFFDQDSAIGPDTVRTVVSALDPSLPGIAGPVCIDEREGFELPSYQLGRFGWPRRVVTGSRTQPYAVDVRISSGTAITAVTFDVAGLMDEDFFLDYTDIEWCLRARARGVPLVIVPAARMRHAIGQRSVDMGPLKVFVDGPVRSYYRVRGAILMLRKREVPFLFGLKELLAELVHHTLFLFIVKEKKATAGACLRAIAHGVAGVTGRAR